MTTERQQTKGGGSIRVWLIAIAMAFPTTQMASARVTDIVITQTTSPAFGGASFGSTGQYEEIKGIASGEIDPNDPRNAVITDIELAPRNANGKVEYSANFTIHKPVDMTKASGVMIYTVPNRGNVVSPTGRFGEVTLISGWQGDIDPSVRSPVKGETLVSNAGDITAKLPIARNPDGSSVTGPVLVRFINVPGNVNTQYIYRFATGGGRTPATLDTTQAQLISATAESPTGVRTGETVIPSSDWAFADCRTVPFPGTPDPDRICLRNGFDPALLYQLVYTAKDPLVLGVGMAAMRDVVSFFRYSTQDDGGTPNPIANVVSHVIGSGSSQSGRFQKSFLTLGFNEDEDGRKVWDGVHAIVPGAQGWFNIRFAYEGVLEQSALYVPGAEGPLWWEDTTDVARNRPAPGILHRCRITNTCPLIFEDYGGAEYWYGRGTVGLVGTSAAADIPLPDNVRRYYNPSTPHGGPAANFVHAAGPAASDLNRMTCGLPANPNGAVETRRALLVALVDWVVRGVEPPRSAYPKLADGTLVEATSAAMGYPTIPGSPSPDGVMNSLLDYDFGPQFRYNDQSGVITNLPAPVLQVIPTLAPKVDADGNEIAGVRSALLRAPLGTYTGWNPVASGILAGRDCVLTGGYIPFARTRAERLATGDPRPSLQERYPNHAVYVNRVVRAVNDLVRQRYLLPEDAAVIINRANNSQIGK